MKVHIQYGPKPEHLAALRERLQSEIRLTVGDVPPRPADFGILVHGFPSRVDITASPMLRALIVPWASVPIETLDLMQTFPGIPVYNLHYALPGCAGRCGSPRVRSRLSSAMGQRGAREQTQLR